MSSLMWHARYHLVMVWQLALRRVAPLFFGQGLLATR
jgi:hypothetical protein